MTNGRQPPPQTPNLPHPVSPGPPVRALSPAPCIVPPPRCLAPPNPVPRAHKALTLWWRKIPAQRLSGR